MCLRSAFVHLRLIGSCTRFLITKFIEEDPPFYLTYRICRTTQVLL